MTIVIILVLFLLVLQNGVPVFAASSTAQMSGGFLRADGRKIVDESGNGVLLRGANFFGYEYGVGILEKWDTHSETDYRRMASWGFNVVRLPISWSLIELTPGKYDDTYLSYIDREIGWAKANGLYVVLDMHDNSWSPRFKYHDSWHTAGVPTWAVSGYPDSAQGEAQARADFWSNAGPNGTLASTANPSMEDRFMQMWKYVASRYASESTVAGYDLLNEPTVFAADDSTSCYDSGAFVSESLPAFYERVSVAIRTVDPKHMVIWEPAQVPLIWDSPAEYLRLMLINSVYVDVDNSVYSPHYPGLGPGLSLRSYDGNTAQLESRLVSNVLSLSERWNQPVFIGEWGITSDATNATQYVHDLSDLQDKYLLGSAWWTYGYCTFGMCTFDDGGNERTTITGNLVRPHVVVWSTLLLSSETAFGSKEFRVNFQGPGLLKVVFAGRYRLNIAKNTQMDVSNIGNAPYTVSFLSITLTGQTSQVAIGFS